MTLTTRRVLLMLTAVALLVVALVWSQGLFLSGPTPDPTPGVTAGGGTLHLAWGEPETLDPALAQDVSSWGYLLHIHAGLVRLDGEMNVVPALADWEVSPDGLRYVFRLREDARFQDGRAVAAADFKYSLERATDPALRSQVAPTYLGDIVGVREKLAGGADEIAGIVVKDERTLEITIDAPKVYFLSKLTYPTASVLDRANVESGGEWTKRPNGAGPFRLASWEDDWIELQRNEHYFDWQALPEKVRFYIGPRSTMAMYEGGELHVAQVGLGDIERALDRRGPLHEELVVTPGLGVYYVGLNCTAEPFHDRNVRRAFAQAVDRDKIVDVTMKGTVLKAEGILPPGLPGHDPDRVGLPFDLAAAQRSLAESEYGGAESLPLVTFTGGMGMLFAEVYWENLGVEMEVQVVREGFFEGLAERSYQMFFAGWLADYPDPENFLDVLFHGDSPRNYPGCANPEVDSLLERARVEEDTSARLELYRQAERLIVEDAAVIPLFFDVSYHLVKPSVRGLEITPMGILSFRGVSVASSPP